MAKLWLQISKRKHLLQGVKVIVSSGRKNWDILMRSFEKKNKNCQNLPFISKIFSNKKIGILFVLFSATWRTNSAQNNVTKSGLWDGSRHQQIDSSTNIPTRVIIVDPEKKIEDRSYTFDTSLNSIWK